MCEAAINRIVPIIVFRVSLVVTETMDACLFGEHILEVISDAWKNLLLPPPSSGPASFHSSGTVIPRSGSIWFTLVESNELARKYMFPVANLDPGDCADVFANISLASGPSFSARRRLSFMKLFVELNEPYDTERLQSLSAYRYLTEPRGLFGVDFTSPEDVEELLQCDSRSQCEMACPAGGDLHAVVAWFRVQVDEAIEICTRPDGPNAETCCWEQAIFPCHQVHHLQPGCSVSLMNSWAAGDMGFRAQRITYPDGSTRAIQTDAIEAPSSFVTMLNDGGLVDRLRLAAEKFIDDKIRGPDVHIFDSFPVPVFGLTVLLHLNQLGTRLADTILVCVVESDLAEEVITKMAHYNGISSTEIVFIREENLQQDMSEMAGPFYDAIVLNVFDNGGDLKESLAPCMEQMRYGFTVFVCGRGGEDAGG